ncbi:hypothetical protein ACFLYU_00885, partial [Candidatus Dependentiae bacterium]
VYAKLIKEIKDKKSDKERLALKNLFYSSLDVLNVCIGILKVKKESDLKKLIGKSAKTINYNKDLISKVDKKKFAYIDELCTNNMISAINLIIEITSIVVDYYKSVVKQGPEFRKKSYKILGITSE